MIYDQLRQELAQHGPMLSEADQKLVADMVADLIGEYELNANEKIVACQTGARAAVTLRDEASNQANVAEQRLAGLRENLLAFTAHHKNLHARLDTPYDVGFRDALDAVATQLGA